MERKHPFTSEAVTEGHLDKVADAISDAIVDAYLEQDPHAHVAVETMMQGTLAIVSGEVAAQPGVSVPVEQIVRDMIEHVIRPVIPAVMLDEETKYYVNPTGRFVIGGPAADTGLTGRKLIVDTYGGMGRHGGGAFSGKDPTKVDRSAAMAARYCAKNVVASGLATRCEVQVAYAISVARPLSVYVDTFGTSTVDEEMIEKALAQVVDLRPEAIIRHFNLRRPSYSAIACYGAFGRDDLDPPWEQTDIADKLRSLVEQLQTVV